MEIPKRHSRWDGSRKYYTKNCDECEFYRKIEDKELCGWGIAFKYLIKTEKPRKCNVLRRGLPEFGKHSVEYLDKIIKEGILIKKDDHNKLDRKAQAKIFC